ncbi:MAG TPA: MotA/TolQ/ExbB proton channel family protein [Anaeromyxobacter sp.]|nr:MotA/TolQ/ExbB proton channel family protein [Anaeromyxobacter sp.]
MDTTLVGILKQGSASMWIIVACSVIALAVAVERAIALWGFAPKARGLADAVTRALYRGDVEDGRAQCERSKSPAADVFLAGLVAASPRPGQRTAPAPDRIVAAVERQRLQTNLRLRRNLWILGTVGATAPFVGLFGTVVGIMHAFRHMALTGQGGFAVVASGISEALVTTAGGIAVAIEAVVIYNFLNVHVGKLALELKLLTEEYLEILREALPGSAAAATSPAPAPRATVEG